MKSVTFPILLLFLLSVQPITEQDEHLSDPPVIDSKILMQTSVTWDGEPIHYPDGDAEVTAVFIEIQGGEETGWHYHPFHSFAYMLEGSLEISLEDGRTKKLSEGESLAEVSNTYHNGFNPGDRPAKLIVFYIGNSDDVLTIMKE